ncbi:MAG: leucyl/phenylalanyl-tRNA--protein transferase [Saprospiraceae bacterium]|nr:leucyl/phenylalanyl-tRNA--protein transferase [Saprospiraceae bacterium]
MPVFQLSDELIFPHASHGEADGLLAIGGDLSADRLLLAYANGIFPWYSEGMPICWYATNPRFVLFPDQVKISKSMQQVMRKKSFRITTNEAFETVIEACAQIKRDHESGTWITSDMQAAYLTLFQRGFARSIEVWQEEELVGGLYGVEYNGCFFGESMFRRVSNASKLALIYLCQQFDYRIIDCQVHTQHLESMGAEMIPLDQFLTIIQATASSP